MASTATQNSLFRLTLFGPLQIQVDGHPLPAFRSRKALWLLALLILRHERPVEREWLAGMLWPNVDQTQAFANLRPVLSELRKALATQGKRLQSPDRHTLTLDLQGAEVDVLEFDAAIKRGTLSDLERAVGFYSGPLLEGCNEEWVFPERNVREQNCLHALQKLGDAALTEADYDKACGYYQQAVRLDPLGEAVRRGWMEALSKKGDTNAALQVYRQFVELLKDDPYATPDEKTSALYQRLRTTLRQKDRSHALATATETASPTATSKVSGYLPHPITDLVGREDERLEVAICLRRSRLVTLIGPGGIGKTRLAREVANEVVREYPDGVWLVALESLSEDRLVIQQIASVLGLREEQGRSPLQRVTEHLRQKRLLLVLDNCEHLIEASAQLAGHLLRECGQVRILATSREALGITGETVWSVPALAVPDIEHLPQGRATLLRVLQSYESVQLFVERAQAVQNTFHLSENNARMVAQTCQRLEGIPLALELAAARVKVMSIEQIVSRLEDHLGLLTSGSRTAQPRQQTLRATLDWSYALLSEAERLLLKRLSVFAGGWVLEAAEQIGAGEGVEEGQVLDLLASLVDKSLVVFEAREPAEGRYRLLEMVRQYAAESLHESGEAKQVKRKHRDWFLSLAEAAEPQLQGAEQETWLQRLAAENDNLRTALAWSNIEAEGAQAGLRLAGALHWYWFVRGDFNEGRSSLGRALDREGAQEATVARAKALNGAGNLAYCQGDYTSARALNESGLTIQHALGDKAGIPVSLNNLGYVALNLGDYDAARRLHEQALAIRQELADQRGIADSLCGLGDVAYRQGDYDAARRLHEQALAIRQELADQRGIANLLIQLGNVAYNRGDYASAKTLNEQGLVISRELGDKAGIADSLSSLASVADRQGDFDTARTLLEESLTISRELGDKMGIAISLYCLGNVDCRQGDYETAKTRLQESLALFRETGHSWISHVLRLLGHVAQVIGDYARACAQYQESLLMSREQGDVLTITCSLEDFAGLAERQGQYERAVRLLGATEKLCSTLGRSLPVASEAAYERTVAAARAAMSEEAFVAAWEQGQTMTLEQAIAYALQGDQQESTAPIVE